jgi:gluconate 2-dehydrogenase gamma chain
MSEIEISRRDVLRAIGVTVVLPLEAAQHVHQAVAEEKKKTGPYKPKCFNEREYRTLTKLAGLIIPSDERSKGAVEAGAHEFIDFLASRNEKLAEIFTGGLGWIDHEMQRRYAAGFVEASPEQQTALLDLIAGAKNDKPEIAPGIRFFPWIRNLVLDAFYTTKIGMDDLGYMGNGAMSSFSVPREAIDYALKGSPNP